MNELIYNDADMSPEETAQRKSPLRQTKLIISADGTLEARPPTTPKLEDRDVLREVAKETISLLPGLLLTRPDARPRGYLYDTNAAVPLDQTFCPRLPKTKVRVVNSDTIDAALQLSRGPLDKPVCVLNMANALRAGGGFKNGALAQEEALCYRSSLHFTLKLRFYPLPDRATIYSPNVLVIRESLADGHKLLDCQDPTALPVISVVSSAAIFQPRVKVHLGNGYPPYSVYANNADREMTREKMRTILRTAIKNKHRKIVLGAFGCGAFRNPPKEVASLWAEILQESEFAGGWWEEVVFAVLKQGNWGKMNCTWFEQELEGLLV